MTDEETQTIINGVLCGISTYFIKEIVAAAKKELQASAQGRVASACCEDFARAFPRAANEGESYYLKERRIKNCPYCGRGL